AAQSFSRNLTSLALPDAVQPPVGAEEQMSLVHSGRGIRPAVVVAELVVGQQLEPWLGCDNVGSTFLRHNVKLAVRQHRRGPDHAGTWLQPLLKNEFSRLGILAAK